MGRWPPSPPWGSQEHHPAWLLGTPSMQGMLLSQGTITSCRQTQETDSQLGFHPTRLFLHLWCVRNMPAPKAGFSPFPPSGMPPPPACLSVAIPSSLGHSHPEPSSPGKLLALRFSQHLLSVSTTHSALGIDCLVWWDSASCQYPISPTRFFKILYIVKQLLCEYASKLKRYRKDFQTAKISP